jgi:ribosome recycling factor
MINDIKKTAEDKMKKSVEALRVEFTKVRTGRANAGILDHVKVDYYGSLLPISQVANISVIDSHTLGV